MKNLFAGLVLVILAGVIASSCSDGGEPRVAKARKPPGPPFVASTVQLPNGDGRVHLVAIPGRYDTTECAVLVTPTSSSISCPGQIDLDTDTRAPSVLDGAEGHNP